MLFCQVFTEIWTYEYALKSNEIDCSYFIDHIFITLQLNDTTSECAHVNLLSDIVSTL